MLFSCSIHAVVSTLFFCVSLSQGQWAKDCLGLSVCHLVGSSWYVRIYHCQEKEMTWKVMLDLSVINLSKILMSLPWTHAHLSCWFNDNAELYHQAWMVAAFITTINGDILPFHLSLQCIIYVNTFNIFRYANHLHWNRYNRDKYFAKSVWRTSWSVCSQTNCIVL